MIIYKNLVGDDKADNPEMVAKIEKATALKLISQILAASTASTASTT